MASKCLHHQSPDDKGWSPSISLSLSLSLSLSHTHTHIHRVLSYFSLITLWHFAQTCNCHLTHKYSISLPYMCCILILWMQCHSHYTTTTSVAIYLSATTNCHTHIHLSLPLVITSHQESGNLICTSRANESSHIGTHTTTSIVICFLLLCSAAIVQTQKTVCQVQAVWFSDFVNFKTSMSRPRSTWSNLDNHLSYFGDELTSRKSHLRQWINSSRLSFRLMFLFSRIKWNWNKVTCS